MTTPKDKSSNVSQSAVPVVGGKGVEAMVRELVKLFADQQTLLASMRQEIVELKQIIGNQNSAISSNSVVAKESLVSPIN